MNGFKFPRKLADEWIKIEIKNDNDNIKAHHIEQGLKLGL